MVWRSELVSLPRQSDAPAPRPGPIPLDDPALGTAPCNRSRDISQEHRDKYSRPADERASPSRLAGIKDVPVEFGGIALDPLSVGDEPAAAEFLPDRKIFKIAHHAACPSCMGTYPYVGRVQ